MTTMNGAVPRLSDRGAPVSVQVDGPFRRITAAVLLVAASTIGWQNAVELPIPGVAKLTGILAGLVGSIAILIEGRRRTLQDAHQVAIALAFWALLSIFWTVDEARTTDSVVALALLVGLLLLAWEFLPGRRGALNLATAYCAGTAVPAGMLLWRHLLGGAVIVDGRHRVGAAQPNDIAFMLCLAIPLAWYVGWRRRGWWLVLSSIFVPVALFAIVLSASRSGLLLGLVAATIVPWTTLAGRPGRAAVVGLALVGFGPLALPLLPAQQLGRLATISSELSSGDLNSRTELWAAAWGSIGDHPIFGVGSGASRVVIYERTGYLLGAHNTFLSVATELGVVGLGVFAMLLLCLGGRIVRLPVCLERRMLVVLAVVVLAGLQVRHWEYEKALWAVFALILATTEPDAASGPESEPYTETIERHP